ncbi:MAG TPA: FimV/HubP family polar landmark protein [Gammaproteobacteria bacterium]|nr:FimV/HubP family polar landmark protein [Gammaproteobacteria bacterium]
MRRLLALSGLILSLGSLSFGAFALGLGNIQLHSALGQKLDADIALVGVDSPSAAGLKVSLAGPAAFQRAKVERSGILQSLKFVVVNGADGYHVHVTSSQPVREPFLTFIVSAQWSSGQVLREYTVLLDPPNYASGAAAAQSPAAGVAQAAPASTTTVATQPQSAQAQPVQMEPAVAATPAAGSNYGPIQRGDTLWGIASNLTSGKPADIDRMMIAIYRNNPHAFAGNINRMRAGYVLEIPGAATVNAISRRDAIAAVKSANQRYLAESTGPVNASLAAASSAATPADATSAITTAPAAPAPAADAQAHLQLVAPSADAVQSAAAPGADSAQLTQLKQQLTAAQQQASAAVDRNTKLAGQVNDLKQQLTKTQRMLNLTNKQLAQLQQQARQQNADKAAKAGGGLDGVIAYVTKPLFLVALLVVLVLIVAFIVIQKQRRKAATAAANEPVVTIDEPEFDEADGAADLQAQDFGAVAAVSLADDAAAEPAESADEVQDPIAEADFHVDYGLYDQAAEIIRNGIEADPGREELKLKLFQIYFAAGDAAAFSSAAQEYASDWGADHPAEWEEVTTMGRQLVPEEPLFAAGFDQTLPGSPETPTEVPTELSTELGTDTATELPGDDEELDEVIADPRDEALNFDFDLGESTSTPDEGDAEPAAEDTFDEQPAGEAQPEFGASFEMDKPATADTSGNFDLSDLEAELNPQAGDAGYSANSLTDTQTEFEDAIRELSEFVDTNFPKESSADNRPTETPVAEESDFAPLETLAADDDESESESFDDDAGLDEMSTKLDLARAYMDMGDPEGARSILEEVIDEGAKQYQDQARELLDKVG